MKSTRWRLYKYKTAALERVEYDFVPIRVGDYVIQRKLPEGEWRNVYGPFLSKKVAERHMNLLQGDQG